MRRTNSKREKPQSNETGGFKFAVTLLAALVGTGLYTKNYVQTTPIDPVGYLLVRILISAALILAGGLLLYILIKGYSMEVHDNPDQKNRLKKKASNIYLVTFWGFAVMLTFLVCIFSLACLELYRNLNLGDFIIFSLSILIFLIVVTLLGSRYVFDFDWRIGGFLIYILFFAIILILIVPNLTPLQGHVTVDMESIYYKNDAPIPVLIHVTGPNPNLSIYLSEEKPNHDLKEIYNLTLKPEHNQFETGYSNNSILIGNALNYGTYNVFINTTNLSAGYYELVCKRPKYEKTYGARGFYLLNSS